MAKTVKQRKTRSDIMPERLFVRQSIATKQQMGRTRLSVEEVANESMSKLMHGHLDRLGSLALSGMKDIVRQELTRTDASGNPAWLSTGVGGGVAREYVHASVAEGVVLMDAIAYREELTERLQRRMLKLKEILDYTSLNSCSMQEAILALNPDAEEQEIAEIVEALEALAA